MNDFLFILLMYIKNIKDFLFILLLLFIFAHEFKSFVMFKKCIKELKLGDFFTLKDFGNQFVPEKFFYVRGDYDFSSKSYSCYKFDVNRERFFKGSKSVFVFFNF